MVIYIAVDMFCANAIIAIADSGVAVSSRHFSSPRKDIRWDSIAVGAAYLFNPLTIATCLGRPTSLFTNFAIVLAVKMAVEGRSLNAMLAIALASYLSLYPVLLILPILLLCLDQQNAQESGKLVVTCLLTLIGAMGMLLYLSFLITGGSWEFLMSTYGVQLLLPDLTPNVGLWWYFFIEMFDSFREFFLGVFWLHLASYGGGLSLRLRRQPLFIITTMLGIFAIFKPYPSISDTSLYFGFIPLYRHVFSRESASMYLSTVYRPSKSARTHDSTQLKLQIISANYFQSCGILSSPWQHSSTPAFLGQPFTICGFTQDQEMPTSSTQSPWFGALVSRSWLWQTRSMRFYVTNGSQKDQRCVARISNRYRWNRRGSLKYWGRAARYPPNLSLRTRSELETMVGTKSKSNGNDSSSRATDGCSRRDSQSIIYRIDLLKSLDKIW